MLILSILSEPGISTGSELEDRRIPARFPRAFFLDAAIFWAIAVGWLFWLDDPVRRVMPVALDTYRDTAYVENVLEGRFFDDPSMSGFSYWYAPGGPFLYAAASKLTGIEPLGLYSLSVLWVNMWIPAGFYIVVRLFSDRTTALIALLMIWLGSRWWQTHLAMPMPSIQGMVFVLGSLAVWRAAIGGRLGWSILLGVVLAVCAWHHILSAIVVSGAIGCHALLLTRDHRDPRRLFALKRAAVAAAVCAVLIMPLAWHLVTIPFNNAAPMRYFSRYLNHPVYALHSGTPLLIPLAILGLVIVARKSHAPLSWVLGYLGVGLVGQGFGYLHRWFGLPLPVFLPHEFQWHGQFAVGILAAVGIVALSRRVARRAESESLRRLTTALAATALVVVVAAPVAGRALDRIDDPWHTTVCSPDIAATAQWIKKNTAITDVFVCRYPPGYYEIAGRTGRKLILMPEARANIAADVRQRRRDLHRLETVQDPDEFLAIAVDRYGARFAYLTDRNKNLLERWSGWGIFETAYRSPNGERTILRLLDRRRARP